MAQKSKKAKPDDHETNDSAIRLISFFAPIEQKGKKAKPYDHEANDSAIWLICLFGSHVRRSKKAKAKFSFLALAPARKQKPKSRNRLFSSLVGYQLALKLALVGYKIKKAKKHRYQISLFGGVQN